MDGWSPNIYFDERTIEPNHSLDDLLEDVRSSRLFLAVSSSAYNNRPWPRKELETFLSTTGDLSRLFTIAIEPLSEEQVLPPLRERHRSIFHDLVKEGSSRIPAPFEPDGKIFFEKLWDLAVSISARLNAMRKAEGLAPVRTGSGTEADGRDAAPARTVLLAQVTEDLDNDLAALRRALEQHKSLRILPEMNYPQGGDAFRSAFRADLAEADGVIQLLSAIPGRAPRDLPEGYVRCQTEEAERAGVKILQWRRSDLQLADVGDPAYRALLQRPTVMASTLPAFIKDAIEQLTAPEPAAPPGADGQSQCMIFVNADRGDLGPAMQCGDALAGECDVILPPEEDEEKGASVQEELNGYLAECDAMLFVQGKSGPKWVRNQLTQALKIRGLNKRRIIGAVLHGPPNGKRPINMRIRGVEELDCTSDDGAGWKFDGVHDVVVKAQRR
jgi:hypothetical protein